jgi:hypothetical protein
MCKSRSHLHCFIEGHVAAGVVQIYLACLHCQVRPIRTVRPKVCITSAGISVFSGSVYNSPAPTARWCATHSLIYLWLFFTVKHRARYSEPNLRVAVVSSSDLAGFAKLAPLRICCGAARLSTQAGRLSLHHMALLKLVEPHIAGSTDALGTRVLSCMPRLVDTATVLPSVQRTMES